MKIVLLLFFSCLAFGEEVQDYYKSSPELIKIGENQFQAMCISCHGTTGKGDTPTGAAVKARDFVDTPPSGWTNGPKVSGIFKTITQGVPGTGMASYESLPIKTRFAIAHYIRSAFVPEANRLADTDQDFQKLAKEFSFDKVKKFEKIPLEAAMKMLAEDFPEPQKRNFEVPERFSSIAKLYNHRCASCHGIGGEGFKAKFDKLTNITPANSIRPLVKSGAWYNSKSTFIKMAIEGKPGVLKPANADLSSEEVDALYNYVRFLADQG